MRRNGYDLTRICELCLKYSDYMKNYLFIALLLTFSANLVSAQRGYTEQIRKDGIRIATKWGMAKDESGTKQKALLLAVENTEKTPVNYSFNILFYYEGILRETAIIEETCIDGLKSKVGKITGTYFIPQKFSVEQLSSPDFGYEIGDLNTEKVDACTEQE